ncbi:MAG: carbamoyltransferase HypF, partial [Deltaproteobacteria bacterium]|nr:carbamoyltransferase HypF [Deltaproteobacteria bacterium]
AVLNICRQRTYEGQPAIELEMAANPEETGFYPAHIRRKGDVLSLDTLSIFRQVVEEYRHGAAPGKIAGRFHNSMVRLLTNACESVREQTGLNLVALSGGVFQNVLLLSRLIDSLKKRDFQVLTHKLTPPNDGCIALGQVAVAAARLIAEKNGKR